MKPFVSIAKRLSMSSIPTTPSTSTTSTSNEVQLVSKPNTTSPVWKYFALEVDGKTKVKNDEEVVFIPQCRSQNCLNMSVNMLNMLNMLVNMLQGEYVGVFGTKPLNFVRLK